MIICKCSSPCSFQAKTSRELTSASSPLLSSTQNTQHSLLHKYQSYWKAAPCTTQWGKKNNPYWKKWQSSNCLGNRWAQNQPQALLPRFPVAVILFPVGFRDLCLLTFPQQISRARCQSQPEEMHTHCSLGHHSCGSQAVLLPTHCFLPRCPLLLFSHSRLPGA